jgi:hypothetical protein
LRFWSAVFVLAAASLLYNSLFDEEHAAVVRVVGTLGAGVALLIAAALWRIGSRRAAGSGLGMHLQ